MTDALLNAVHMINNTVMKKENKGIIRVVEIASDSNITVQPQSIYTHY